MLTQVTSEWIEEKWMKREENERQKGRHARRWDEKKIGTGWYK